MLGDAQGSCASFPLTIQREDAMRYALRNGLHHADLGGHIIFLDMQDGRYFSVPNSWNDCLRNAIGSVELELDKAVLPRLLEARLLVPSDPAGHESVPALPLLPERSLLDEALAEASRIARWRAALAQWLTRRALSRDGLSAVTTAMGRLERRPESKPERALKVATRWATAFLRSGTLVTSADNCLIRSTALAIMLRRRNVPAQLVLGVTASPFSAHAWVQMRDLLLNDRIEHVRSFTPIWAL